MKKLKDHKGIGFLPLLGVASLLWPVAATRAETPFLDWSLQIGTSTNDISYDITTDGSGNIYVTGQTNGSFLGGPNYGGTDAFLVKLDASGSTQWATWFTGTGSTDRGRSVAVDGSGNVYFTGDTGGDFGGANAGNADAFLFKYDSSGVPLWSRQLGTTTTDASYGVAADGLGNVYITGRTDGSLATYNPVNPDAFLAKYDSEGSLLWTRQIGSSAWDISWGMAVDGSGNAYITGFTDLGISGPTSGLSDAFLVKYDPSGSILWSQQIGTTSIDEAFSVAVDTSGNAYIAGRTQGPLGGANEGGNDVFLAKYSEWGGLLWSQQIGTPGSDISYSVAVDGYDNAYISGSTGGSLGGVNAGGDDVFLAKYDASGSLLWSQQYGTSAGDISRGVAVDIFGHVYITGQTAGSLFGSNEGGNDVFIARVAATTTVSNDMTQSGGTFAIMPTTLVVSHASNFPTLMLDQGASTSGIEVTIVGSLTGESGTINMLDGSAMTTGEPVPGVGRSYGSQTVYPGNAYLGLNAGSSGYAHVGGTGTTWTIDNSLFVGLAGHGTLEIAQGGAVATDGGYLGKSSGSNGSVTVAGLGSQWTNSGDLVVGDQGTGGMSILADGFVSNAAAYIGKGSGSNGSVYVGLSQWHSTSLVVGDQGTGTLFLDRGYLHSGSASVGASHGSSGTVIVAGAPSLWQNLNGLVVGDLGAGTLSIESGGAMNNGSTSHAWIGRGAGSIGSISVTGIGSSMTANGGLTVGESGVGTLSIDAGGRVSGTTSYIGRYATGNGDVTVADSGSQWTSSGWLYVGLSGIGALLIDEGGFVSNNLDGFIGMHNGSSGSVTVSGIGSTWINGNNLILGGSSLTTQTTGTGTLNILNGGLVSVVGTTRIHGGGQINLQPGGTLRTHHLNASNGVFNFTGGTLILAGGYTGSVTVPVGGILSGTGTITGDVTVNGTLSPGNSPGTLPIVGNSTWSGGGDYLWEINNATGTAGSDPGWDLYDISGTLTITATSGNKFTIDLTTLTLGNSAGAMTNFNPANNYMWPIATADGGIIGFSAAAFDLDLSGFTNSYGGTFSITHSGNSINLIYTGGENIPEPASLGLLCVGGVMLLRRRR